MDFPLLNLTVKTHCYVVVTKQLPSFCPFPFLNVIEYNWILFWKIWKHIKIISEHVFISKTPEKTVQFKSQAIQYKHINIRSIFIFFKIPFEPQKGIKYLIVKRYPQTILFQIFWLLIRSIMAFYSWNLLCFRKCQ